MEEKGSPVDFLLFMPAKDPGLRAILSYFSTGVKVSAEGDVTVNDETIESLGMMRSTASSTKAGFHSHVQSPEGKFREIGPLITRDLGLFRVL